MGESAPPGGFRVFQSQHSREQRRRLHHLPRVHRSDAPGFPGEYAAYAVVLGLPQKSGAEPAADGQSFCHGLETGTGSGRVGAEVHGGTQDSDDGRTDELFDLSSLVERMREAQQGDYNGGTPLQNEECSVKLLEMPRPLDLAAVRTRLQSKTGK